MAKIIIKETGEIKDLQTDVVKGINLTKNTVLKNTNYAKFYEDGIVTINGNEYEFWKNYFVAHYWVRILEDLETNCKNM